MKILIPVEPRTKKNSMRLVRLGRRIVPIPSKQYKDFEEKCSQWLQPYSDMEIDKAVNVRCLFYMKTRRKVDLTNLLEAGSPYHIPATIWAGVYPAILLVFTFQNVFRFWHFITSLISSTSLSAGCGRV